MTDSDCPDYGMIKALALTLRRPAKTLYALSDSCDPFYVTPAREAAAAWFADVWAALDPPDGVHLRRLHYNLVSLPDDRRPTKLDGSPYQNTENDWEDLGPASVDARVLGLVDAGRFTDRRAGEPVYLAAEDDEDGEAEIAVEGAEIERPEAESAVSFLYVPRTYALPEPPSGQVIPPVLAEPYALEIWAEKSTMNDILEPLARVHNLTLVSGVGELSFTHCHRLVARTRTHGKSVRLLYISDFDPSGDRMPVSVARQVEYLIRSGGHDFDVRLDPLVLTREQVERYRLPRIPIKDSDLGKKHFEDRFGEGATELDALEALHPGELRRIVVEAIARYRLPALRARAENRRIAIRVNAEVEGVRQEVLTERLAELADLRQAFTAMRQTILPHQQALAAIAAEATRRSREHIEAINAEAAAFYERAAELWSEIGEALEERVQDAGEIDWASPDEADEGDDPLFDSARGYVAQIDRYKAHQGKPTTRRGNGGRR